MMEEIPNTEFKLDADLVLLAIGFVHPEHEGLINNLGIELDARGNVKTDDNYRTSNDKIFAAGDMRSGQSLIVKAINEGSVITSYSIHYTKLYETPPLCSWD